MTEEDLEAHLRGLCAQVKNYETAIFNFHVPPHGYSLDLCPKLDEDLTMSAEEKIHAGSLGAKKMIEKYQPLLGLFGHIHESRGAQKAGRTLHDQSRQRVLRGHPQGRDHHAGQEEGQGLRLHVRLIPPRRQADASGDARHPKGGDR